MSAIKQECDYHKSAVEPDRVLAQIVKVDKLEPIAGADNIELAHVLGWQCVVRKGEFTADATAIYISIDAVLDPESKDSAFLQGKRLKTKVIMKTLSQGLLAPLSWLQPQSSETGNVATPQVGDDVTKQLKIRKYVAPMELNLYDDKPLSTEGDAKKRLPFPTFVPKTDEERAQNMPKVLSSLVGSQVVVTRKEDGTSTTFVSVQKRNSAAENKTDSACSDALDSKEDEDEQQQQTFLICGRNTVLSADMATDKAHAHYFEVADKYQIKQGLLRLGRNLAVQGETVGPKINGNHMKLKTNDFYVFNVWDIDAQRYLDWDSVVDVVKALGNGLQTVPVLYRGPFKEEWTKVPELLKMAEQLEYAPGVPAEGMVIKTTYDKTVNFAMPRHSFKVISNKFLLKHQL